MMDSRIRKPPGKDTSGKGSRPKKVEDVLPVSCNGDTFNGVTCTTPTEIRAPKQEFTSSVVSSSDFCSDVILDDGCATVDNNLDCYPLGPISQLDNGMNYCNNDCNDQGNSDLLYDGWPDIGNFEDIDMMFRSCDSTFGLGTPPREDELCWFPSSHTDEGSYDVMNSGFNISTSESSALRSVSEDHEGLRSSSAGPPVNDFNKRSSITRESNVSPSVGSHALLKEQVNLHRKHPRQENQPEEGRKNGYLENGNIFHQYDIIEQLADVNHRLGDLSSSVSPALGVQQHKNNVDPHSIYMQTNMSHTHPNGSEPADQLALFTTHSSGQSGSGSQPSRLAKESSYASNQVLSVDSAQGPSFDSPISNDVRRENPYHHQDLPASVDGNVKYAFRNLDCNSKQVQQSGNHEGHNRNEEINISIPGGLESNNANGSLMALTSDGISMEAASLHQLQQVLEKLDIRTKLWIRDSLYRLARSVKKRHDSTNLNGATKCHREAIGTVLAGETDKCAGYMDMETSTNPIDRSIAQLLFHRSSDPSSMSDNGALSFQSLAMENGSISSPAMTSGEKVFQEETSNDADKQFLSGDK